MKKTLLITSSIALFGLAQTTFAQSATTIINEAVPAEKHVIVANSPEDLALQEEIRKIRAYNAYVDSHVGVSDGPVEVNPYQGAKIELYAPTKPATFVTAPARSVAITPTTTIIKRQPIAGSTAIHSVVEGDTLYSLAKSNCLSVGEIQAMNGLKTTSIRLGQVLTIPASQCAVAGQSKAGYVKRVMPVPINVNVNANNYAVLPKDTLYSIGRQYCVTPKAIAGENGIPVNEAIHPGQILRLPSNACIK